jgi:hypothetical protein
VSGRRGRGGAAGFLHQWIGVASKMRARARAQKKVMPELGCVARQNVELTALFCFVVEKSSGTGLGEFREIEDGRLGSRDGW